MQENLNSKLTIRIGRNTLSFTTQDATNMERPIAYEPYPVKAGISMAANLREALKINGARLRGHESTRVLIDTPSLIVPTEQFEPSEASALFEYSYPAKEEKRVIAYNVLPSLKVVCLFAINKDLRVVIGDNFGNAKFIHAMLPVWQHLHQRSFTGNRSKLYGYFHGRQLDVFSFHMNRFKFCNAFDVTHPHDALYYLLHVWKQLRLEEVNDELHLAGDIPEREWLTQELGKFLRKTYIINPEADFSHSAVSQITAMPYDLMTLLAKGR